MFISSLLQPVKACKVDICFDIWSQPHIFLKGTQDCPKKVYALRERSPGARLPDSFTDAKSLEAQLSFDYSNN